MPVVIMIGDPRTATHQYLAASFVPGPPHALAADRAMARLREELILGDDLGGVAGHQLDAGCGHREGQRARP